VALGPDDEVQAFVTWTPLYAGDGWSLDNMRRAATTEPGAMELLLAECITWAKGRGCARVTLGLAPFAGVGAAEATSSRRASGRGLSGAGGGTATTRPDAEGAPPASLLERSAAYLHRRGLLLGNYRSLHAFKAKFQVDWQPRYLMVGELGALPRVLSALGVAMGVGWRGLLRDAWEGLRGDGGFPARVPRAVPASSPNTRRVATPPGDDAAARDAGDEASA
jgi:phosphatidylglycerol lysyltransferase